jgi:1-acyl-sn-glycerol-3-phosphate acyltransferase
MIRALLGAVSLLGVLLAIGLVWVPAVVFLVVPSAFVSRARRLRWVTLWAYGVCWTVLGLLWMGGARYVRRGWVRTDEPGVIVMNHQSLLDIPTAVVMTGPIVPAFIARERYAKVPGVSTGIWLADCPVVSKHDREAGLRAIREAVLHDRMVLIYPEGHRTCDGDVQPFRTAGLLALLEQRRVPVWLIATDGFCAGRRLIDFVLNVGNIRGRTEVVGRYDPPADAAELPAFVAFLEEELRGRVRALRGPTASSFLVAVASAIGPWA